MEPSFASMLDLAAERLGGKVLFATDDFFAEKENALEMIGEIKNKISTSQKIPNFLIEGLKNSLNKNEFKAELDSALNSLN